MNSISYVFFLNINFIKKPIKLGKMDFKYKQMLQSSILNNLKQYLC